ncbi:rhomboid family intramembrane serine protease [Williamsia sp.]|uniref:rhomboid family intramembrane serine protease n=1 Tax=Williamsia sp. TaxID=1872085 RepID=UPI002F9571F5
MTGSLGSYGATGNGPTSSGPPAKKGPASWPLWARSAVIMLALTALLYVIEFIDVVSDRDLDSAGIEPREVDGLSGIAASPFLHADWEHLVANTIPGMVLGFLVLMTRHFLIATAIVWVVSGLGVWLFAPPYTVTVGASGIIFGWLTYILVRGLFNRNFTQVLIGVVVFLIYGGILWGVVPAGTGVSWQGHLFGAAGGILAAWYLSKKDRKKAQPPPSPYGSTNFGNPGSTTL